MLMLESLTGRSVCRGQTPFPYTERQEELGLPEMARVGAGRAAQSPGSVGRLIRVSGCRETPLWPERESPGQGGTGTESAGPPGTIASGGRGPVGPAPVLLARRWEVGPVFSFKNPKTKGYSKDQRICQKPVDHDTLSKHQGFVMTLHGGIRKSDAHLALCVPARPERHLEHCGYWTVFLCF